MSSVFTFQGSKVENVITQAFLQPFNHFQQQDQAVWMSHTCSSMVFRNGNKKRSSEVQMEAF